MSQLLKYTVTGDIAFDEPSLRVFLSAKLNKPESDLHFRLHKRSVDARGKKVKVNIEVQLYEEPIEGLPISYRTVFPDVSQAPKAIIVGAGPAGMFAALRLVELGIKPIVLDRGKDVRARRRDLAAINKEHIVNDNSNYCFGEGGAGTYSDGKLYTRSKKRGSWRRILEIFVAHGASPEILVDAHPHIGTNKLPKIVQAIRESIIGAGGEFHFSTKVVDFLLQEDEVKGVKTEGGVTFEGISVMLATGHSARDIFELLHKKRILIEAKPFALGVRVEHAQNLIDQVQYHQADRGLLPPAPYSLATQVRYKGTAKGVFSFCMCPGGFIVPSATASGEVVVNGMSPSRRNSKYANSGIVVSVDEEDWKGFKDAGPLAGLRYQEMVEKKACQAAGNSQKAPAQLLHDFVNGKVSKGLLPTSYQPGLASVNMRKVLPNPIGRRLQLGFKDFGKKMRGFLTNEAQIVGVESRTSSPVRIPRDRNSREHPQIKRLFPCGEGAGYAGGIASAAMDGERCAERIAMLYAGLAAEQALHKD